jgi:hypothetical protein
LTAFVAFLQWGPSALIEVAVRRKVRIPLCGKEKMASFGPIDRAILVLIALPLQGEFGPFRQGLKPARLQQRLSMYPKRFFEGMNVVNALALAGAMSLALSLLADAYGADWGLGALTKDISLGLAGWGAGLALASIILQRRSRNPKR